MSRTIRHLHFSLVLLALAACHSDSGFPEPPPLKLALEPFVSSGLSSPVFLTQPFFDGRIFVVEQPGRIRLVKDGVLQATSFLDITSRVLYEGERGLLSVAFDPQYGSNHYFYVFFTEQPDGDIRIERFTATNFDVADAATSKLILTVPHSQFANHNGGLLAFGNGDLLYAGIGDGGGNGDPLGSGQDFNSLLGSLIRIDVTHGDPYLIPPSNPFAGQAGKRGEIWAKGLRNPWRYAFDPSAGLLYIADVGQDSREEVDVVPVTAGGLNYGWNVTEGSRCYNASTCNYAGFTAPVLDYDHSEGCSITGGYVYRGTAIPRLKGHYLYSDYCGGFLRSFRYDNGVAVDQQDWGITTDNVTSFGQDFDGELYLLSANAVYKIVEG